MLDLDVALGHVDGDAHLLAELAGMFLRDYQRLLNEASDSILQRDHSGLERASHTLRGRLAFFGIHKAREQLLELEMMGRRNELDRARQVLTEVETELLGILPELELLSRELSGN